MKKVFVDTNFIIDLVARPEFSPVVKEVLTKGRDCIITRNKKDFMEFSQIPVFTPLEFLQTIQG